VVICVAYGRTSKNSKNNSANFNLTAIVIGYRVTKDLVLGDQAFETPYSWELKTLKKKLIKKRLTIGLSQPEIERLEAYCKETGRNYSDVIRECIRKLKPSLGS
jgi:hypothetical protein